MNSDNVLELCEKAANSIRAICSDEAEKEKFACNIQQVKPKEFDILYYGIFFDDKIEIFSAKKTQISRMPNYSKKQHKGNKGEGQFHIKNKNIAQHRKKYKKDVMTYEELYELLKS